MLATMKKRITRLSQIIASMSIMALTLTGCYFVDGSMNMADADGDLRIEFDLTQGVETALFDSDENAREYVMSRYGSPWRYSTALDLVPFTIANFGQSARVTKNGVAHRFKDKHGNEISVVWADTEYRMEFRVTLPENVSEVVDPQVTLDWNVPQGWVASIRSSGNGSAIVTQNSVAWYGATGNDVVVIGLQPPQVRRLATPLPETEEEQPGQEPEQVQPGQEPEQVQPGQESAEEANVLNPGNEASPQPGQEEGEKEVSSEDSESGELLPEESEASPSDLLGSSGVAATKISGEPGLVEIGSEFFPAIALNNDEIRAGTEIRVIGVFTDGVLVEPLNPQESGFNLWAVGGIFGAIVLIMAGIVLLVLRKKGSAQQENASSN